MNIQEKFLKVIAYSASIVMVTAVLVQGLGHQTPVSAAIAPELPRVYVNSAYPVMSSSRTIFYVDSSCIGLSNCRTSLQSAIDSARQGDEIIVTAGMTISGPIYLRNQISGTGQTTVIRTSNATGLPGQGTRVTPNNAGAMAKIVAPGSNQYGIATDIKAHDYRIVGIEVTENANNDSNVLVQLGKEGSYCSTPTNYYAVCDSSVMDQFPYNIVLDRMYIHGTPTNYVKRGVGMESKAAAIIDSYISEIHIAGQDSQAIAGIRGPGPYKINNNYIEGAAENLIFGGDQPFVTGLVPSDIEVRNNYFFKPLSWMIGHPTYNGRAWSVKNLFELKNTKRILIQGNVFENDWTDGQAGVGVLFTVRGEYGGCYWCTIEDVTFRDNIVKNMEGAINILGHDDDGSPSGYGSRMLIENNLFLNINGLFVQLIGYPTDITINHNTVQHTGNILNLDQTSSNVVYTNNISNHNSYGIAGANTAIGQASISKFLPGSVITKNVMAGNTQNYPYPAGNYFPASLTNVGFMDMNAGNFTLSSASPYKNAGTDGRDLGIDSAALTSAIGNPVAFTPTPAPTFAPTPTPSPTPTQNFTQVGGNEIVIHPGIDASLVYGNWTKVADSTAASGMKMYQPNKDAYKIMSAMASPGNYFEAKFYAEAGKDYHVWMRGLADNNNNTNDSVHMQFSDSTDTNGTANYRIGWNAGLTFSVEEGVNSGLSGWGWNDNDASGGLGSNIRFAATGMHTIRVQQSEDGIAIDQIVISPQSYLNVRPGQTKNDSTLFAENLGNGTTTPVTAPVAPAPAPAPSNTPAVTYVAPTPGTPYPDGTLINDNGTIYIMEYGKKRGFTTMAVLNGLGYCSCNARATDSSAIEVGEIITTSLMRHTRGALVNYNGTVYFMGADQRLPFPSYTVFKSWGGDFKYVVVANKYDLLVPAGPIITEKIPN